ncbi:galactose-specific lectin nattectin-like [Sebastes umbrosus]|uniref:galactose-specific lectin nattectin-like n=1 Tax=Sebastes umbrosus TaxID=72105 RepID=UPI00189FF810|nr:galactose-specific lectin nattectin-like [Sebastes umbrosus]
MASGFRLAFILCLAGVLLISETWSCSQGCPSGWTRYGSRCFRVVTARRNVATAERTCIALGGNLASIHSSGENNFVRGLIFRRYRSYPRTWIGLTDAIQERIWMWTDGSRVRFARWGRREPNNSGNEDCTEINFRRYYWNDEKCHNRRPFVCARRR